MFTMNRENPYMPIPWTRPDCFVGQTWEGWLVFLGRNRDAAMESEGGES